MEKTYYVYRHVRHDNNEPFYIGLGTKSQRNDSHIKEYHRAYSTGSRNSLWHNIVNKTTFDIEILYESDDFTVITNKEIEFINLHGRRDLGLGSLVNMTDGGGGIPALSVETRAKISEGNRRRVYSEETKAKLSKAVVGIPLSEERKKNISLGLIGHRGWNKDRIVSQETRDKQRASMKGKIFSDSHIENLKKARANRSPMSEETKKKISDSKKRINA